MTHTEQVLALGSQPCYSSAMRNYIGVSNQSDESRLTEERMVRFIHRFYREKQYSPSYREIAKFLGISTSTVSWYLQRLRRRQLVTWEHRVARSLRPTVVLEDDRDIRSL